MRVVTFTTAYGFIVELAGWLSVLTEIPLCSTHHIAQAMTWGQA